MKENKHPRQWYESEGCWNCEAEDLANMNLRCRPIAKRKPRKILCCK